MSRDRIPEIKMATAMFNVAKTPECYPDKEEDISTELTVIMNTKTLVQD
jgi:hypothetical protein